MLPPLTARPCGFQLSPPLPVASLLALRRLLSHTVRTGSGAIATVHVPTKSSVPVTPAKRLVSLAKWVLLVFTNFHVLVSFTQINDFFSLWHTFHTTGLTRNRSANIVLA